MFKFKNLIIFLAGASFFHTISHIVVPYIVILPFPTRFIEWTPSLNAWAIGINAAVTVILLLWASRLKG
jgi:hypothetical protein